jgi:hypothetical protein
MMRPLKLQKPQKVACAFDGDILAIPKLI